METRGTIDPKQDGLGMIDLIRYVTHRRDDTAQSTLDTFQEDKDLMLCHQKLHILITQYLAEFKARTEVVTVAGGKPGKHPSTVKLVGAEQCLEVDSMTAEESTENR